MAGTDRSLQGFALAQITAPSTALVANAGAQDTQAAATSSLAITAISGETQTADRITDLFALAASVTWVNMTQDYSF